MVDLVESLKKQVQQSGFPLELWVHQALMNRGWYVLANRQFMDPQEDKPRELDIESGTFLPIPYSEPWEEPRSSHQIQVHLIMECKHDPDGAWVFFYPPDDPELDVSVPLRYYPSIGQLFAFHSDIRSAILEDHDLERHHYFRARNKSRSFFEPVLKKKQHRKTKDPPRLYGAVNTVIKAAIAHGADRDTPSSGADDDGDLWSLTSLYYPVILYDGRIFTCTMADDDPELAEVRRAQLLYEYPLERQGLPLGLQPFLIDVIHRDALDAFVSTIEDEHKRIANRLGEDIGRFEQALKAALPRHISWA